MNERLAELIDWASVGGNRNRVIESKNRVIDVGHTGNRLGEKDTASNRLIDNSKKPKYHSSHRFAFTFYYSGKPIKKGKVSKFGRYCDSSPSYRYKLEYPEYRAVVFAYERSLLIWIKKPKGRLTVEQLIEARKLARECSQAIAFKYQIAIEREKEANFSEHIVISKPLDRAIRPLVQAEPELMRERCGITINKRSHKGRLEHHDRDRRPDQPPARVRVPYLEDVLEGKTATKEDIGELRGQLTEISQGIKEMVSGTKELNNTIRDLVLGSVKPPEQPGKEFF